MLPKSELHRWCQTALTYTSIQGGISLLLFTGGMGFYRSKSKAQTRFGSNDFLRTMLTVHCLRKLNPQGMLDQRQLTVVALIERISELCCS